MKRLTFTLFSFLLTFLSYGAIPPASEVFKVKVELSNPSTFIIKWQIKPGFFLYANKIKILENNNFDTKINIIHFPETEIKSNQLGNILPIYRNKLVLPVAVLPK